MLPDKRFMSMLRKTCRQPSGAALARENALGNRNEIGQQEASRLSLSQRCGNMRASRDGPQGGPAHLAAKSGRV